MLLSHSATFLKVSSPKRVSSKAVRHNTHSSTELA